MASFRDTTEDPVAEEQIVASVGFVQRNLSGTDYAKEENLNIDVCAASSKVKHSTFLITTHLTHAHVDRTRLPIDPKGGIA